jgi:pilus assembly protein CpaB
MSARSLMIVTLSLIFGGSAAVGVNSLLNNPSGPRVEVVPVVVAAMDLPRGGNITVDLVKVREFPKDLAPAGALSKVQDAMDRGIAIPLMKDDPVVEGKLTPKGAGRGLAALIPTGMRAYSVKVPEVAQGVAGFILPGNRVDVLLSIGEIPGSNETGGGSTTTLLQNVEILAVDQKMDAPTDNKMDTRDLRTVTLLVTPQQANLLDLGQNKGVLHLALRNLEDKQAAQTHPATMVDLRYRQEKPWDERAKGVLEALGKALSRRPPAPQPPPPPSQAPERPPTVAVRTIRGTHESAVMIQATSTSKTSTQAAGTPDVRN